MSPSPESGRSDLLRGLHLAALSAFTLAQPLFDVLAKTPEFFVARGSTRWDIITFAIGVLVVPPAVLFVVELLVGRADARLRDRLHIFFVAALVALTALQTLKRIGQSPSGLLLVAAAALGAAAAYAYATRKGARSFVTALAPAPLVFLALFLFNSPVQKLIFASKAHASVAATTSASAPIVMVVFDELPTISLMDERHEIDASLYPTFAALARGSTWFRNATSVNDDTLKAVPALLTGNYPKSGLLPTAADHPRNLFTLLAGRYRLKVVEAVTRLCPRDLCRGEPAESFRSRMRLLVSDLSVIYLHILVPNQLAARLPPVTETWMNFRGEGSRGRPRVSMAADAGKAAQAELVRQFRSRERHVQFDRVVASIGADDRQPTLYFLHVLLPHSRWTYLPSGKQYANAGVPFALDGNTWSDDEWLVTQAYQRHLLQVAFVDRLLGTLLRRLRDVGLYDPSLIVVTADHGIGFRPGEQPRDANAITVDQIAPMPLFVKAPNQREGRISDQYVQAIDILPTIADLLGVRLPWPVDGRSAVDTRLSERREVMVLGRADQRFVVDGDALERGKYAALARKLTIFGSGRGITGLFRIGPHPEIIGRRVGEVRRLLGKAGRQVLVDDEDLFRSVDLASPVVPALISGQIVGDGEGAGILLAIAVNGRIAATTRTFLLPQGTWFTALVPESVFRQGANEVEVFRIAGG
jgi:hypothetical protein